MDALSPTWMHDLIEGYGLWVLFFVVMLESMGVPVPGETALVTTALYAGSTHRIDIVSVVLVAAAGAMIGDNTGYLIGRSIGVRLLVRYGRYIRLDEARLKVGSICFCGTAARSSSSAVSSPFYGLSRLSSPGRTACPGRISC
jgi:membrane protein DedA with SNARE-associated domain